jgi:class 3 adenylate cyclase
MSFDDDVKERVSAILNEAWVEREGRVIPTTASVSQKNGAVKVQATFLYADLARSTHLQKAYVNTFAAKAIRMYLAGAASIIRHCGGSIKSFDGDRVMGVFIGDSMRNDAVRAAYGIQWLVTQVIAPMVKERHEANNTTVWVPTHGIGIDSGETFIARAGVRNSGGETSHNDLVFIGRAPNVAAKLSALRDDEAGPIVITNDVYRFLNEKQRTYLKSDRAVWSDGYTRAVGPHSLVLHKTAYWRSFN